MDTNRITGAVISAAMKVHTALGPGMLESVYERCLCHELTKQGFRAETQVWLPVFYDGVQIEGGYRIDLLVDDQVVVELKTVDHVLEIHKAQLLSYLKLSGKPVGLLINFNVAHLRDGIKRLVNTPRSSMSSASSASPVVFS
jgi:GxxExxY protein